MSELPVQQVLLDAIEVIEGLGIPYAVMGGFAARAWGLPRPTFDADIAVVVDGDALQSLFDAMEEKGFDVPEEHRRGFLDTLGTLQKAHVTRFLGRHVWHTDLFIAEGDFLRSAVSRARAASIGGAAAHVMTPEDIILLKLIAHRRKDLADVEDIAAICPDLDGEYLRRWATTLGVADALREFFPPDIGQPTPP